MTSTQMLEMMAREMMATHATTDTEMIRVSKSPCTVVVCILKLVAVVLCAVNNILCQTQCHVVMD